ncbi:uncharacterized protein LOC114027495 [Vombatus ursinus]|uniref:uncharacterized protein LOC114027495 n=1 Tax=Vombatus ursinus TaxID=29139 RepID=UPI000FFCFD83|nr:uncharacterized protein LOC114027495 [Vombatus ursinus]
MDYRAPETLNNGVGGQRPGHRVVRTGCQPPPYLCGWGRRSPPLLQPTLELLRPLWGLERSGRQGWGLGQLRLCWVGCRQTPFLLQQWQRRQQQQQQQTACELQEQAAASGALRTPLLQDSESLSLLLRPPPLPWTHLPGPFNPGANSILQTAPRTSPGRDLVSFKGGQGKKKDIGFSPFFPFWNLALGYPCLPSPSLQHRDLLHPPTHLDFFFFGNGPGSGSWKRNKCGKRERKLELNDRMQAT